MGTTIGEQTEPLRQLVTHFLERYPLARAADVYRLLHDGACVGEGETDAAAVRQHLEQLAGDAAPGGELVEPAVPDGTIVRVHLGPFVAAGGSLEQLAEAVATTEREASPRRDLMFTLWGGFVHMNRRHEFRLDRQELEHFEMRIASANYPRVDHSETFEEAYRPRYAVVRADLVPPSS